jgi:hypothetical protein
VAGGQPPRSWRERGHRGLPGRDTPPDGPRELQVAAR